MDHQIPVLDLHCDLLAYLALVPGASLEKKDDIGVALSYLREGKVAAQVMAIFTSTSPGSTQKAQLQVDTFQHLITTQHFYQPESLATFSLNEFYPIAAIPAIENASGICEEDEPLKKGLDRLDKMLAQLHEILYISLTHHEENRFGGGNYSNEVGLKSDGKLLLDHLSGKKIAVDLSHASDQLALGVLNHITTQNLDLKVIASHSNFRPICNHVRNLPNEITREIILRSGIIGINFVREYIDNHDPEKLDEHIEYGVSIGAKNHLALGADFFYVKDFPDPGRYPLYHQEHSNAGVYQKLFTLWEKNNQTSFVSHIAHQNALKFTNELYKA